jgi:membrane associated rhomboid family serine protease
LAVAEVDLNVVCKNCGSEVSPYITECPYCGHRLRKRAPKLRQEENAFELAPEPPKRRRTGLRRGPRRARRAAGAQRPLAWMSTQRPYATIVLIVASAVPILIDRAGTIGLYDLGAIVGPLDGEWWRLVAAQFAYENVGYLFAVCVAVAIFGSSLERRYGAPVVVGLFLASGAAGMYLATLTATFPIAMGGNGSALGLLCAWLVRDIRDRHAGNDTESDLIGVAAIGAVLVAMPLLETTADAFTAVGGAAVGALVGLLLPERA